MKKVIAILALLLCAFTNVPRQAAFMRALNKQTGRTSDIEIPIGGGQMFENLLIEASACFDRPADEEPEDYAFVKITETSATAKEELATARRGRVVFSGWMFSSSPSLSAMDHPDYDIWLLKCR